MDSVPLRLKLLNRPQVTPSRERRLESKRNSPLSKKFDFAEHQPTSAHCRSFRGTRRHSLGNQVSIDEVLAIGVFGKKLARECSLAHAVRARNYVEIHEAPILPNLDSLVPPDGSQVNRWRRVPPGWERVPGRFTKFAD
jgi:hypothetical protein